MRIFLALAETIDRNGQSIRQPAFDRTGVTEWGAVEIRPDRFVVAAQGIVAAPANTIDCGDTVTVLPANREVAASNFLGVTRAEVAGKTIGQLILLLEGGSWVPHPDGKVRIGLAGEVLYEADAIQGGAVEITEPFTYSNGRLSTVSSAAWDDESANMNVSSNAVVYVGDSTEANAAHNTELSVADHYAQVVQTLSTSGVFSGGGCTVRGNGAVGATGDGYRAEYWASNEGSGDQFQVYVTRLDDGVETQVASALNNGAVNTSPHTIRAEVVGTTVEVFIDAVSKITYGSASSYTTNKFVGMYAGKFGGGNITLDSFEAGRFGAVPDAPTGLVGRPADTAVALDWTLSGDDGGSAITDHDADWAEASAPTTWLGPVATGSASPSYAVTGLTNGTAYVFRVRAVNGVGDGTWSASSAQVTPDVQSAAQLAGGPIQSAERLA